MSNANYSSCLSALEAEINTYENFVYLSLGVTLICSIIRSAKAEKFKENPALGAKVLFSFAILKVILGIILLSVFPGCPEVCTSCANSAHHYIYPTIVFTVAFFWFVLGNRYRKLANAQAAVVAEEEGNSMVETTPTSPSKGKELV
mmetsp:Transcript_30385/g.72862  ORF Transcript_30385/g.72862 Transcript_30385/m.72862 type:complete len:146 (-) Transcript_30385:188-625(-)|eukprot:CAMPEP_0113632718 /NCGR_PEP_ID=MMETSP0017_2-20120614/17011_1 /TAXON_ID=2856 /ORGANISM="Cylindrotheca closterium" /LENGTH=145 /DNA_ID=CAMNT_0000543295 /DNA_START=93 /DNA_END=530 /DNA_ORIENTATION=+ /assembly_acc=CAM_ASM_000147